MMRILIALALFSQISGQLLAEAKIDFAKQIQPLLQEKCAKCHGERNAKGDLRLHTAAAIRDADVDYLLNPKAPDEGELLARIILPKDDDLFMPKGGKPLAAESIALIRKWIEEGAIMPEGETTEESAEEDKLPEVPPASQEAIAKLTGAGAQVLELYSGSPLLRVTFAYAEETAGDDEVTTLTDVAEQVFDLNLARSQITDVGTAPLATLKNLRQLHLELTSIGDDALVHLSGLKDLRYLNLYGTKVTDAGLAHLKGLKNLDKLYLWQTSVSYDAAMALQDSIEGLEVNLGWNHPEVAKRRLQKELDRVTEQHEDAKQREEQAKQERESAEKRKAELEKELNAFKPKDEQSAKKEPMDEKLKAEEATGEKKTAEAKPAEDAAG